MTTLKKIYKVLDKIRAIIICATFSFIVLLCFYQVIARYVTFLKLRLFPWGDEIIRMTSVWISFMAASIGVRSGAHLSVDIVMDRLPDNVRKIVKIITNAIVLLVMAALVYYGIDYTRINTISKLLNVNIAKAWFYASLPVGAAYMFMEYLIIMIWGSNPFIEEKNTGSNSETDAEESDTVERRS